MPHKTLALLAALISLTPAPAAILGGWGSRQGYGGPVSFGLTGDDASLGGNAFGSLYALCALCHGSTVLVGDHMDTSLPGFGGSLSWAGVQTPLSSSTPGRASVQFRFSIALPASAPVGFLELTSPLTASGSARIPTVNGLYEARFEGTGTAAIRFRRDVYDPSVFYLERASYSFQTIPEPDTTMPLAVLCVTVLLVSGYTRRGRIWRLPGA